MELLWAETEIKRAAHQEELDRIQAEKDARLEAQTENLQGASNVVNAIASVNNPRLIGSIKEC